MAQPQTLLDKFVGYISPRWAAERFAYKQAMLSYRGALTTRMGVPYGASTSINGVRQPTLQDQRAMRDRARNLERNNPLAAGVLDRAVENVIGTGIRVEPRTESAEFNVTSARCGASNRFRPCSSDQNCVMATWAACSRK
jgi:capsid protein